MASATATDAQTISSEPARTSVPGFALKGRVDLKACLGRATDEKWSRIKNDSRGSVNSFDGNSKQDLCTRVSIRRR